MLLPLMLCYESIFVTCIEAFSGFMSYWGWGTGSLCTMQMWSRSNPLSILVKNQRLTGLHLHLAMSGYIHLRCRLGTALTHFAALNNGVKAHQVWMMNQKPVSWSAPAFLQKEVTSVSPACHKISTRPGWIFRHGHHSPGHVSFNDYYPWEKKGLSVDAQSRKKKRNTKIEVSALAHKLDILVNGARVMTV